MLDIDTPDALSDHAGYKVSRAALREKFGARRIDASAPQSANDGTPSGRMRRFAGQGMGKDQAIAADLRDFRNQFLSRAGGHPAQKPPAGFGAANPDAGTLVPLGGNAMAPMGASTAFPAGRRFQPRGLPLVQQPEMIAASPVAGSPIATPFQNDMGAVFGDVPLFRRPRPFLSGILDEAARFLE